MANGSAKKSERHARYDTPENFLQEFYFLSQFLPKNITFLPKKFYVSSILPGEVRNSRQQINFIEFYNFYKELW